MNKYLPQLKVSQQAHGPAYLPLFLGMGYVECDQIDEHVICDFDCQRGEPLPEFDESCPDSQVCCAYLQKNHVMDIIESAIYTGDTKNERKLSSNRLT